MAVREPGWRAAQAEQARRFGATLVDPIPWMCTRTCPAVIGNTIVYRDAHHLTATFAATVAALLDERLPASPSR